MRRESVLVAYSCPRLHSADGQLLAPAAQADTVILSPPTTSSWISQLCKTTNLSAYACRFFAGAAAGFVCDALTHPFDTIRARIMGHVGCHAAVTRTLFALVVLLTFFVFVFSFVQAHGAAAVMVTAPNSAAARARFLTVGQTLIRQEGWRALFRGFGIGLT